MGARLSSFQRRCRSVLVQRRQLGERTIHGVGGPDAVRRDGREPSRPTAWSAVPAIPGATGEQAWTSLPGAGRKIAGDLCAARSPRSEDSSECLLSNRKVGRGIERKAANARHTPRPTNTPLGPETRAHRMRTGKCVSRIVSAASQTQCGQKPQDAASARRCVREFGRERTWIYASRKNVGSVSAFTAPQGQNLIAQGCRAAATLGRRDAVSQTLKGFCPSPMQPFQG